ncbi:hypothetical protein GCM10010341_90890 [Streptomyces noursei]|nr:hypothetical protein GCM10010341_90890 [Streptomyces noursei]
MVTVELLVGHCHVVLGPWDDLAVDRLGEGSAVESAAPSYKGHRYPVEIISHCVWLYFRFPLSFREVEELMLERGVVVSYETIRRWCAKLRFPRDAESVDSGSDGFHERTSTGFDMMM